jgi:hypothetical protein
MFYIKTQLADGMSVATEITPQNVYCHCPDCGNEVSVNIAEVFAGGESDLYSTSVCCAECTKRRLKEVRHD